MPTSVKLDENLKARLQDLAERQQRSAHWLMREAIRDYLDREESKENFKQEAMASWKSYKTTGLHLTGDEVRDWIETWGSDDESDAPTCHE